MINEERICSEFAELVQIDAPCFGERRIADAVKEKLISLGFEVQEDRAGERYGSDTGNLYGYLKGGTSKFYLQLRKNLTSKEQKPLTLAEYRAVDKPPYFINAVRYYDKILSINRKIFQRKRHGSLCHDLYHSL